MTPEQRPEVVQVEESDRELFSFMMALDVTEQPKRILAGDFDGHRKMQAIAAHRIAAEKDALERAAQVDYAREALSRQDAERIVAARIDEWGWGPADQIDGLAEHELAVRACQAGLAAADKLVTERLRSQFDAGRFSKWTTDNLADQCSMQARGSLDPEYTSFMTALADRLRASHPERRSENG